MKYTKEDFDISVKLAKAIGWQERHMLKPPPKWMETPILRVQDFEENAKHPFAVRIFDYRYPDVCLPLIQAYQMVFKWDRWKRTVGVAVMTNSTQNTFFPSSGMHESIEKAVAMALIDWDEWAASNINAGPRSVPDPQSTPKTLDTNDLREVKNYLEAGNEPITSWEVHAFGNCYRLVNRKLRLVSSGAASVDTLKSAHHNLWGLNVWTMRRRYDRYYPANTSPKGAKMNEKELLQVALFRVRTAASMESVEEAIRAYAAEAVRSAIDSLYAKSVFGALLSDVKLLLADPGHTETTGSYNREITLCLCCKSYADGWGAFEQIRHGAGCKTLAAVVARKRLEGVIDAQEKKA